MKTCSCGRRYSAPEWLALPAVGNQFYDDETGRWHRLELRNCSCKSTMAIEWPLPVEVTTEGEARMLTGEA